VAVFSPLFQFIHTNKDILVSEVELIRTQSMDNKSSMANSGNNMSSNAVDPKEAKDVIQFVQTLLQSVQDKFQQMSDQILSRIDEMGHRIDDLEHNLNELVAQSEMSEDNSSSNPIINSNAQQINK